MAVTELMYIKTVSLNCIISLHYSNLLTYVSIDEDDPISLEEYI